MTISEPAILDDIKEILYRFCDGTYPNAGVKPRFCSDVKPDPIAEEIVDYIETEILSVIQEVAVEEQRTIDKYGM